MDKHRIIQQFSSLSIYLLERTESRDSDRYVYIMFVPALCMHRSQDMKTNCHHQMNR